MQSFHAPFAAQQDSPNKLCCMSAPLSAPLSPPHAHCRHDDSFPVHLGYCQASSPLQYSPHHMDRRNILWLTRPAAAGEGHEGSLWMLHTERTSPLHWGLLASGVRALRTVHEGDLGYGLADVAFLNPLPERKPQVGERQSEWRRACVSGYSSDTLRFRPAGAYQRAGMWVGAVGAAASSVRVSAAHGGTLALCSAAA